MAKWEYKMTTLFGQNAKEDKENLDSWGKEGWELISVVQTVGKENLLLVYLKRVKK
jgi:hypothetical protein